MKVQLLLTLTLFCLAHSLHSQIFVLEHETIDSNFQNVDLDDYYIDLRTDVIMTNTSSDAINVKWSREVDPSCPMEWLTYIGDINMTYLPSISTNIDPPLVNSPFTLNANETANFFNVFFRPQSIPGCCQVKIHFSLVEAPDDILATATINTNVNMTEDCQNVISSTHDIVQQTDIQLFPNPASDYFSLNPISDVEQMCLINSLGQQLAQWDYEEGRVYPIAGLPKGPYTLQLFHSRNIFFKSVQLLIGHE